MVHMLVYIICSGIPTTCWSPMTPPGRWKPSAMNVQSNQVTLFGAQAEYLDY